MTLTFFSPSAEVTTIWNASHSFPAAFTTAAFAAGSGVPGRIFVVDGATPKSKARAAPGTRTTARETAVATPIRMDLMVHPA